MITEQTDQSPSEQPAAVPPAQQLRLSEAAGKRLLLTAVLGSGMVFLDGTIANVALPQLGREFEAPLAGLQWVINGYALSLAALILIGGSFGDRFGRKRIFRLGVVAFAACSVLVAISPTLPVLIVARVLQGVAAALLTPGSLAMLQASFVREDRMAAIGAWSGMLGVATAAGPVVGGWLVSIDWRIGFWVNLPLALIVLLLLRGAPESSAPDASSRLDLVGVLLAPLALVGITWALTAPEHPTALPMALGGVIAALAFLVAERRSSHPMLPLGIFRSRVFSGINLATFVVYAAFPASSFFMTLLLQVTHGWSPFQAGLAVAPVSVIMLALSSRFGKIASARGPLAPMVAGMTVVAAGYLLLSAAPADGAYVLHLLPGILLQGLGMSMLVAPLTGTVLQAAPSEHSGLASGVNNAVSRTAGLMAIAALPQLVGLTGTAYQEGAAVHDAYGSALRWCALLMAIGAVVTVISLRNGAPQEADSTS